MIRVKIPYAAFALMKKNMNGENMKIAVMGFTCLDIINDKTNTTINLGGTAGNVASVLSSFGLEVYDFVPDYSDEWSIYLNRLLQARNIHPINYVKTTKVVPKVIESINTINNKHSFFVICPKCNKKLNDLVLPTEKHIMDNMDFLKQIDLLFIDRISSGITKAIEIIRNRNGLIIYEPNVCRFYEQLFNGAKNVDIVKFSHDRISDIYTERLKQDLECYNAKLIINTMGENGLRYCVKNENGCFGEWIKQDAIKTNYFVDASGAGDWLTASFIYYLYNNSIKEIKFSENVIGNILMKSQELSSFACEFIGAQEIFENKVLQSTFIEKFKIQLNLLPVEINKPDNLGLCEACYNKI